MRDDVTPTDQRIDYIHMYLSLIDNILHDWYEDPDVEEVLQDDYFLYFFAPPNLVIRTIDANRNYIDRRVIRRTRRRAGGKENLRPLPSA